jgi:heat shock protein HtpX
MAYSIWIGKRIYSLPYTPPPSAEGVEYKEVHAIELPSGRDVVLQVPQRRKFYMRSLGKIFSFDEKNKQALRTIGIWVALGLLFWLCLALLIEDTLLALEGGGYSIRRAENPELWNILENLCMTRGIPMPKLKIMETSALNAFAFGYSKETYGIALTRGLAESLNKQEVEALLAHELTHIRNGDAVIMMIATLMVGIFVFLAERIMSFQEERTLVNPTMKERRIRGLFLIPFLLPLYFIVFLGKTVSVFIKIVLSHKRDYLADAGAIELTSNPDAMISALNKIAGHSDIPGATSGLMAVCIDDPRPKSWFDTRPSLAERIEALHHYVGGLEEKDPGEGGLNDMPM